VVEFYKQLFGSSNHSRAQLANSFWPAEDQLDEEDKRRLMEPFSEKEVYMAIESMKSDSAPGPNGFTVVFLRSYGSTSNRRLCGWWVILMSPG
jgi:hypothetical protein